MFVKENPDKKKKERYSEGLVETLKYHNKVVFVVSITGLNFGKYSKILCVFGRPSAPAICANTGHIAFFSDSVISSILHDVFI